MVFFALIISGFLRFRVRVPLHPYPMELLDDEPDFERPSPPPCG